ncbi:TetR/AcrR family transcriptional regulator [Salinispira pacifica]|uniref:Transcriptional regulator, TetR family n=1 Tax=Salinispira pacifica TaxID=1307761 RepID=V5WKK3_9SPIO|nr:TetR/AcrR family transcriptional regulator [Salinispira pacifica]AHC16357.1 Transcriptional regulator, TetR family [Salinispira pacifica]
MSEKNSYHHGNLRESLISIALEELEKTGLDELSLRALADRLGVSKTAPYRHFATKRELLASLAAEGYELFANMLEEREEEVLALEGNDRVRRMYELYGEFARTRPELYRLMFSRLGNSLHSERCRTNAERAFASLIRMSVSLLRPPDQDPRPAALSLFASMHGWATLLMDDLIPPDTGVDWSNWQNFVQTLNINTTKSS